MKRYEEFGASSITGGRAEDLLFIVDVSSSMNMTDFAPSRIRAAAEAGIAIARRKAEEAPQDRIGVITFGSTAQVELGLTKISGNLGRITGRFKRFKARGSTNMDDALAQAWQIFVGPTLEAPARDRGVLAFVKRNLFEEATPRRVGQENSPDRRQRIVLLSDGEHDLDGDPIAIARDLKDGAVTIDCIGIGGHPGAEGLDERTLQRIASDPSDGRDHYFFIGDSQNLIRKCESLAMNIKVLRE